MDKKKILHDLDELEAVDTEEMDRLVFGEERFEMLELNRTMIKSINRFLHDKNIKTAFLTIVRTSRSKYEITPGTFIITKERGRFPVQ